MSRLCRLKTKTHGKDGQWAYDEIIKLRQKIKDNEQMVRDLAMELYMKAEFSALTVWKEMK